MRAKLSISLSFGCDKGEGEPDDRYEDGIGTHHAVADDTTGFTMPDRDEGKR